MKALISTLLVVLFIVLSSWIGDDSIPLCYYFTPVPLQFIIPKGWPKPKNDIFKNNPLTEEGFQLGRKLFYDGRLSKDGNFACNTCHQQFSSFSNFDHDFSHGFNNSFTTRNAPPLINLAWMDKFHWDGAINHIEMQPLAPITSANEMGESLDSVLNKLEQDSIYKRMFKEAFGSPEINSQRMLKALAQFTGSLVSADSKYDQVKNGTTTFSISEQKGYVLYKTNCSSCHPEPLFTDNSFRNNGLSLNPYFTDIGRMKITGNKKDSIKFKVPTLRNVAATFPYMHDGRIKTLMDVIDHYRSEIVGGPTLDPILKNPIIINDDDKQNLYEFLLALTDRSFVRNPRFARIK